jgi:predicted RNA binding protein YcfA (HicA-like mRNA interferase family)
MVKLPVLSGKSLIEILQKEGFVIVRQRKIKEDIFRLY